MAGPLTAARAQDAAAWFTLAVALLLAPWSGFWDAIDLPQPDPPGAFAVAGAVLACVAVAHAARDGGRRAVLAALVANLLAAAALIAWLGVADPATGTVGTIVLAVTAASLLLQAGFDGAMLRQDRR